MRRHTLIGRLGPQDAAPVACRPGDVRTSIDLVASRRRLGFGIGDALWTLRQLGLTPPERAVDLALLGAVVTAADTRISRDDDGEGGWTREIDLHLPVSEPTLWQSQAPLLKRMLDFLTGDRWRVEFRARPADFDTLSPPMQSLLPGGQTSVCLYSGGLDSFIGALDLLCQGERPILASHYWDGTTSQVQKDTYEHLRARFGNDAPPLVRARVGFKKQLFTGRPNETTLRARSFMFFGLAALTASAMPAQTTIYVPENGFISLNVPLDPLRVGALSTRTTHPFYMNRWNELLANLGLGAHLHNPYQFMTKGEMTAACRDPGTLASAAPHTMSCSSPSKQRWRGGGPQHCGYCVPCLIRRAALQKGMGGDPTVYTEDLWAGPLSTRAKVGQHVRSFQSAYDRLRRRPALARTLIHQSGPLFEFAADLPRFERVYADGLTEVGELLAQVRTSP